MRQSEIFPKLEIVDMINDRSRLRRGSWFTLLALLWIVCFVVGCSSKSGEVNRDIAVHWGLVTNFTGEPNVFEAEFTLTNKGKSDLGDQWTLFFNIAPRPIAEPREPQAGTVKHINGDWYKLVPNEGFALKAGGSIKIRYWGTEGVIKETDRPLAPYFVFSGTDGKEEIVPVADYTFAAFEMPDQINRGDEDEEPIPTPEFLYEQNSEVSVLPVGELMPVIPTPVRYTPGKVWVQVDAGFVIVHSPDLKNEASFLAETLEALTGVRFKLSGGNQETGKTIRLGRKNVLGGKSEAYELRIARDNIAIEGTDAAGVFYGIQTLRALIPLDSYKEKKGSFSLPVATIFDGPRFEFRGVHLDVSRNFQTKETVKRILDILSMYKVNRFLFYTTEDEGWRIEIKDLPELTAVGARRQHTTGKEASALHPAYGSGPYADGENNYGSGYYTREDFVEILKYANARHIKVIPELNFPGHARAAIKAMEARYERLMKEGKEEEANQYRLIDPEDKSEYLSAQSYTDNVVSVARESTFRFYEKVVDELAVMYKEAGLVMDEIHAGGDEVPEGAWTKSPMARELMSKHPEIKDPKNLQTYFFRELLKRLKKRNLRVNGWEEVALLKNEKGGYDPNPEFVGQDVVPFIWNNLFDYPDLAYRLANAGYPVVMCNVSNFYFDLAYTKDPREPGLYWAGFVDTRDAWLFAPFDMYKTTLVNSMGRKIDGEEQKELERLLPSARKNILGLEAQLWSETIKGRDMVEYYLLPKLFGFAESAWAAERPWETIADDSRREGAIRQQWNAFANALGQRELPRLSYVNSGYNYRVPPPGAVVRDGVLHANASFPGLEIRYTTDGSEPTLESPLWTGPVKVNGPVSIRTFDSAGKGSRSLRVATQTNPERLN